METSNQNSNSSKFGHWLKHSITARMLIVGFLTIVLLLPLALIEELIYERSNRQNEVISDIGDQWGNEVLLYGPILKIPYKKFTEKTVTDSDTKKVLTEIIETTEYAYFFPEKLDLRSEINPEPKERGIYKTTVYQSEIQIDGSFNLPDFSSTDIKDEHIEWNKTKLIFETSNLKGVSEKVSVEIDTQNLNFESKYGGQNRTFFDGLRRHLLETDQFDLKNLNQENPLQFSMKINVKGSEQFRFIPIGKETTAQLVSNWKDPNFTGEFLPYNPDKLTDNGFDAKWKILDINRPFSQEYYQYYPDLSEYASGVNFKIPVNEYQKNIRSVKYGFMVIALTFLIFFLIQSISKIPIHPFQYLMIGIALTMFYTLLISITEHSNFLKAYLISAAAVLILITTYSRSILKSMKFSALIGLSLFALYSFIYVIIQLENYALIVGSIGLFIILAIVMFVSRKIDWDNAL